MAVRDIVVLQKLANFAFGVGAAPTRVFHDKITWLPEQRVVCPQRCSQRASTIAGGRLYIEFLERGVLEDAGIGHAVEAHTTGDAEPLQASLLAQVIGHANQQFLRNPLNAGRDVGVVLVQLRKFFKVPGRRSEVLGETSSFSEKQ